MDAQKARHRATALDQLPLEILHVICYHLDISDILRLRRLSRYLNKVSRCRNVWSDAYRKADIIRPPGPYPSQSAHDLENALVTSFRVSRNLGRSQAERTTRRLREILWKGRHWHLGKRLVFGRFLLAALSDAIRCYDLNCGDQDPSIIYRATGGTLKSFHCGSAFDVDGRPFDCLVLSEMKEMPSERCISIYSMNAGSKFKVTLDPLYQIEHSTFEVDSVCFGPRVIVIRRRLPDGHDFSTRRDLVIIDVHTWTQFLLPPIIHMALETKETSEFVLKERTIIPTIISTSTHLLLAKTFYSVATNGHTTFFQAFSIFSSDTHCSTSSTPLSLSHSGIMPGIVALNALLLRDAVLDVTTQDVLISIQVQAFGPGSNSYLSRHGILRLSAVPASNSRGVGTITLQLLDSFGPPLTFHRPSFGGAGRVFDNEVVDGSWVISALEYNLYPGGRDGEQASKVTKHPCILRWPSQSHCWVSDYDPYSGQLCVESWRAGCEATEVLDLAV